MTGPAGSRTPAPTRFTSTGPSAWLAAPVGRVATVSDLAPGAGGIGGGTRVRVVGTGFATATRVRFGGVAGPGLTVVSDTMLEVTTPARGRPGRVNVQVDTAAGLGAANPQARFRYMNPPTLTAISP
jgi:hypothetical protein